MSWNSFRSFCALHCSSLAEGRGVRSTPFGSAARRSRMEQGFDAPADAPIAAPVAASAPPPSNTRSQKRIMELAARLDLGLDNPDLMQRILTEARKREENVAAARKQGASRRLHEL